jgi:hypothetical protein
MFESRDQYSNLNYVSIDIPIYAKIKNEFMVHINKCENLQK